MANATINLFYFYKRYLWTAQDFTDWQSGMVDTARGMYQGAFGAAVLQGFEVTPSGMNIEVASGIAVGPTGNLLVNPSNVEINLSAPVGNPSRSLIVGRVVITDNTYITNPIVPFDSVPLKQQQGMSVVLIPGTPAASPVYPSVGANDVILCGVRLQPAQSSVASGDIDLNVRDIPGKNSNFQQDFGRYDDRLRPFRYSSQLLGIKPSQLGSPFSRVFSYVNKVAPSIFPKTSGGLYNPATTFLNFQTGAITGGDQASSPFTPQIPSAGNAINAMVGILSDDTITVLYGTQGTRAQCFAGIVNQAQVGAGSVQLTALAKIIAFVTLYSADGSTVTELDYVDGRGTAAVGETATTPGLAGGGITTPGGGTYPLTLDSSYDGKVLIVDSSAARTINLFAAAQGFKFTVVDKGNGGFSTNPLTLTQSGGTKIQGLAQSFVCETDYGSYTFGFDGTDWELIAR